MYINEGYMLKLFLSLRVDDQNTLKMIKLGNACALFSHWNSIVLWFYVQDKLCYVSKRGGKTDNWSSSGSQIPVGFLPLGLFTPSPLLEGADSWPLHGKKVREVKDKEQKTGLIVAPWSHVGAPSFANIQLHKALRLGCIWLENYNFQSL